MSTFETLVESKENLKNTRRNLIRSVGIRKIIIMRMRTFIRMNENLKGEITPLKWITSTVFTDCQVMTAKWINS